MTGRVVNNLIEVRQGDSFPINLQIKRRCKPVNLTGASVLMQVKDSGGNVIFQVTDTPVDALNGRTVLLITPQMTSAPVGEYVTDIQLTESDGSVNTIFPENVNAIGTFRITEQVTTGN